MTNRLGRSLGLLVGAALMFAACGGDGGGGGGGGGGGTGTGGNGSTGDMAMGKSGACTNANDTAIGKPAMDSAASACGLACYADKDTTPPKMCSDCVTMKIMDATQKTITPACNACWTNVIICGIKNCSAICLQNGAMSAECRDCTQKAGCDSAFSTCSGL
jgi:hypothetical protein